MSDQDYIINVTEDSMQALVEKSQEVPILFDFWATWCGPCKTLGPILTKLAQEYQGKFILAKVDVDANQNLAAQFGARSIPTIKLIFRGQIIDEFVGAIPESEIRAFLDKHITAEPEEADNDVNPVDALLAQGQKEAAIEYLQAALQTEPNNLPQRTQLATLLVEQKNWDGADIVLNDIDSQDINDEIRLLQNAIEFGRQAANAPDIDTLLATIETNPDDLNARAQLGNQYVASQAYGLALDQFLWILGKDRSYGEDMARKSILSVFELLGNTGPLVSTYRRKMTSLLF